MCIRDRFLIEQKKKFIFKNKELEIGGDLCTTDRIFLNNRSYIVVLNAATAEIEPNKPKEIEAIREVCRKGEMKTVKPTKIDVKLIGTDETIYLFDIKTAKPNAGGFKEFKSKKLYSQ